MKNLNKNFLLGLLAAMAFAFSAGACSQARFSKTSQAQNNGFDIPEQEIDELPGAEDIECQGQTVCLVVRDNFERADVSGADFNWSRFLDDRGSNLGGLDINIRADAPASSGNSALYFTGRPGNSVHSLYIISKQFDLRDFQTVTVEFDYILAGFESYNYQGDSGDEHLRVDLCTLGAENCGVGVASSVASARLKDDSRWSSLYSQYAVLPLNQHLNGTDHSKEDFTQVRNRKIEVDLNNPQIDKSRFMIRWAVKLTDGIGDNDPDAGIIDNIVVRAYR